MYLGSKNLGIDYFPFQYFPIFNEQVLLDYKNIILHRDGSSDSIIASF